MKILFLNRNGYGNLDIIEAINRMQAGGKNIDLCVTDYDAHIPRYDEEFCSGFVNNLNPRSWSDFLSARLKMADFNIKMVL